MSVTYTVKSDIIDIFKKGFIMPRYTDTQEVTYLEIHESVALTVQANGGQLDVHVWDGENWIETDTFTATESVEYYVKGLTVRFTPSGGCAYSVPRGR